MSYLAMPHNHGWVVCYTEMRTFPERNGRPEYTKEVGNSCYFKTREEAWKKAEELKAKGKKIKMVTECIY